MSRIRKKLDGFEQSKTDQSYKKQCDVNILVKQYRKTGVMPQGRGYNGKYGDFSEVPTLEEAFNAVKRAQESFQELPAGIRKLMDNDASKLEIWLSDVNNRDLAIEHGLLNKPEQATDNSGSGGGNEGGVNNSNGGNDASASN